MANPTSNYGWQMPTPTDLVTDLPADFEVFGQAVDTSLLGLKGGTTGQVLSKTSGTDMAFTWATDPSGIPATIVDAKGDIIAATAADAVSRLAVGANNTVLTADSTTATGLKWAAAAGGGMTEISTTTLSGATVTLASIPQTYKSLYLLITRVTNATANGKFYININGAGQTARFTVTTETTVASAGYGALLQSPNNIDRANDDNGQAIFIHNYTSASNYNKPFHWFGYTFIGDASAWNMAGIASQQSAAVTSIVLSNTGGSLSAGTVILYGVS